MTAACADCGGPTAWDDAAASEICTSCGTLTDASQVILTNHDFRSELTTHHELRDPVAPRILKSRSNYTLAGQGQGVRDQKNALTMANFIRSLAVSMNAPGLTPRATTLFNQAKAINYFRWGTRAKTVAGACLCIALRESRRPDSIPDISALLNCSPQLLSRTFISLASALKITTLFVDPSVYIGTLQGYLTTILQEHQVERGLPAPLLSSLRQVSIRAVANTALSLGRILPRSCLLETTSRASAASTACAIFMLSLEAENRDTLESVSDLAKTLATRCHIGKGAVMSQYKIIQDQVAGLIEKVPWLEHYQQKGGRAKISKRLVVARGLKDVVRFNEEILQKVLLPAVYLELTNEEKIEDIIHYNEGKQDTHTDTNDDHRPTKRPKIHQSLDEASRFLLNPFNVAQASSSVAQRISQGTSPKFSTFPLTSYVLSTASLSSICHKPPTRLQLLAAARGGSDEGTIHDEELFDEGELEALIRSDHEVSVMKRILDFDDFDDDAHADAESPRVLKAKVAKWRGQQREPQPKKSRVDFEAFAKLMSGTDAEHADEGDEGDTGFSLLGLDTFVDDDAPIENIFEDDDAHDITYGLSNSEHSSINLGTPSDDHDEREETVLDAWRPASPLGGTGFEDRYEEEYD